MPHSLQSELAPHLPTLVSPRVGTDYGPFYISQESGLPILANGRLPDAGFYHSLERNCDTAWLFSCRSLVQVAMVRELPSQQSTTSIGVLGMTIETQDVKHRASLVIYNLRADPI